MQDGLYIAGKWVSEIDFSLNYQGNDLTQPDSRTASFSNTFTLPDSLTVRTLLQGAEQLDAGGPHPYRQLPAFVIDEGERTFSGFIEFVSFSAGWKVNLLESVVSFFDAIKDKMLTGLDLSRYDHPWTLEQIAAYAGSVDGVVYPCVDYGGIDSGIVPYDTMCPGVYAKTLFGQICKEAGYKPVGEWLNDPLFTVLALPFVNAEPRSHDEDWVDDRTARVTANKGTELLELKNGHPINVLLPLNFDNLFLDGFQDGKLNCFKADRAVYVCPERMHVLVQASVSFVSITRFGAAEIRLILERNGQPVEEEYFSEAGYSDQLDLSRTIQLDTTVSCMPGDELRLRLTGSSRTDVSDYAYYFSQEIGEMWASFMPDPKTHFGDEWKVARNLPSDISCTDLVLTIAKAMCGTFVVDESRKTVKFSAFDEVITNIPVAKDWSRNVDESTEPETTVRFEGYGAANLCKWKEADEKVNIGYGDGNLPSPAITTPKEETLFELPFMACVDSENFFGGYGNPILIKTRKLTGYGDNRTVDMMDAAPRLILIEPTKTVTVQTKDLSPSGDIVEMPVTLTGCWWAKRPTGIRTDENSFSLAFSPVAGQNEQPLLDRYFKGLKRVLRRPRMFSVSLYLQPSDVAMLDLSVPIRLQKVRVGSQEINDNYFYLNKLGPYRSGMVTTAVLIAV